MKISRIYRKIKYKKQLAISLVTLASIVLLYPWAIRTGQKITHYAFNALKTPNFSLEYNRIYAHALKQEIAQFMITQITDSFALLPKTICKNLTNKFTMIERFTWCTKAPHTILISVTGTLPAYVVNNTQIIGQNRKVFNLDMFKNYDITSLKRVNIDKSLYQDELSPELYAFLDKIPDNFWCAYEMAYHAPHNIELQKKIFFPQIATNNNPRIIIDEKTLLNGEKIKKLAFVQSDMQQERWEHARTKPKDHQLIYDVRFENRIIVKMLKKRNVRRGQ